LQLVNSPVGALGCATGRVVVALHTKPAKHNKLQNRIIEAGMTIFGSSRVTIAVLLDLTA
jgi:hypothetical protein